MRGERDVQADGHERADLALGGEDADNGLEMGETDGRRGVRRPDVDDARGAKERD